MSQLGTLEELPLEYREALTAGNLAPLWPSMRAFLPYDMPERNCRPTSWHYKDVRPLLMRAGDLTPIEKAERRVLILANPGLGLDTGRATPSIYLGLQLILPGETAPNHRHTPSAIRFVIEGDGGFTMVQGEKLPMEKGDLILTPPGLWHEHGHEGKAPVVWLDVLDLPLIYALEASYCNEGDSQPGSNRPDRSQTHYRRAGLLPYGSLDKRPGRFPQLRFPWKEVRQALIEYSAGLDETDIVQLAYVDPETGQECLPTLGFSALMLRPGQEIAPKRRSASTVLHAIEGAGTCTIDGVDLDWEESSTVAIPTHAEVRISNASKKEPAFLFVADDAPLQRKLCIYTEH
jgi:gentisate 1,2-dioxygenase